MMVFWSDQTKIDIFSLGPKKNPTLLISLKRSGAWCRWYHVMAMLLISRDWELA